MVNNYHLCFFKLPLMSLIFYAATSVILIVILGIILIIIFPGFKRKLKAK